jgi:glycosyltransferase involved in cell wall biosynthesis
MTVKRVIITVPDLNKAGGVAALFSVLKMEQHFSDLSLFCLHGKLPSPLRIPIKYLKFIIKLYSIDVVHLNPSLNKKSFLRDAIYAWITVQFSKKLIVYWHGWNEEYEAKIKNSWLLNYFAKHSFFKAHTSIVLGTVFEKKLKLMGFNGKIHIETNTADNKYLTTISSKKIKIEEEIRLLFLSRLEEAKGIYIAIDTVHILNKSGKGYKLIIAGSGSEEANIKQLVSANEDIEWAGYITGEIKHNLLSSAHFMFLPSYTEGMPLTLLEGMMYGLPIISRPVGGIPDIIKNDENGYLIESLNPEDFAEKIYKIVNSPVLFNQMSQNNIEKSNLFSPESVRERLYDLYQSVSHEK